MVNDADRLRSEQLMDNMDMQEANIEMCVFHVPFLLLTDVAWIASMMRH